MGKYLVLLDIDGVFTSNRVHVAHNAVDSMWQRLDIVVVDFMNYIHDTYNAEFVIMSTWARGCDVKNPMIEHWVRACFASAGFRGQFARPWKTDPDNIVLTKGLHDRAYAVKDYLDNFGHDVDDFILFDEAQFLTREQVWDLSDIVDYHNINVICYGLKLNWKAELFEGSKALMELADELIQMDSICKETGNPALFHYKHGGSDSAIETGFEDLYSTVSRKVWKELQNR